jgi:hypothetical protein
MTARLLQRIARFEVELPVIAQTGCGGRSKGMRHTLNGSATRSDGSQTSTLLSDGITSGNLMDGIRIQGQVFPWSVLCFSHPYVPLKCFCIAVRAVFVLSSSIFYIS